MYSVNDEFEYDNLVGRPGGRYVRLGAKLHSGIRKVQRQIEPYAAEWRNHNAIEHPQQHKPLWIVLGDSMAQGVGASGHDRGWVGLLRDRLQANGQEYRLINLSMSGARIADVLERQLPAMEALGEAPALITVMIGSNDLVRKKYRQNALADFDTMLERLPQGSYVSNLLGDRGVPVAIDMRLQRAVAAGQLHLVDMRRHGPRSWRGKVAEDYFHPNDVGYRAIADVFARAMGIPG